MSTNVLICRSPMTAMLEEVRGCEVETGGPMFGLLDPPVVIDVGVGGDRAVRLPTMFKGDVEADRRNLARARQKHGQKVGETGHYHRHPPGMPRPSGQDQYQAHELFMGFGDGRLVLVGIFTEMEKSRGPSLFLYAVDLPDQNLEPVPFEVVDDDDPRVKEALRRAPLLPGVRDCQFWSDESFQFFENPVGRERIRRDLAQLRRGDQSVLVVRRPPDDRLRVLVNHRDHTIELAFPREYPLNPPQVFLKGVGELVGLLPLVQWSSSRSITSVVRLGFDIARCPHCRRRHVCRRRGETRHA